MTSTILVVQHEDDDPIHLMGEWMDGVEFDVRRPDRGDALPASASDFDAFVVMGGVMGANDEETTPWLAATKELIRGAAADKVPTLGICLGHQLAAVALGGEVQVNSQGRQFGPVDVGWQEAASYDELFAGVATPRRGAHWNDDIVVRLPEGAELMAVSPRGEVQAARHAPTVWGVQWHPEVDRALFDDWVVGGDPDPEEAERALTELGDDAEQFATWWRPLAQRFAELAGARAHAAH